MIQTLHKNVNSDDELIQLLISKEWTNQKDIADAMNISTRTFKRRVSALKSQRLLIVHRYKGNNFIYATGEDIFWTSYEALAICKFRYAKAELNITEEKLKEVDVFNIDTPLIFDADLRGSTFTKEPVPKQSIFKSMHLDWLSEKVIIKHKLMITLKKAKISIDEFLSPIK